MWMMFVLAINPNEGVVGSCCVPGTGIGADIVTDCIILGFWNWGGGDPDYNYFFSVGRVRCEM